MNFLLPWRGRIFMATDIVSITGITTSRSFRMMELINCKPKTLNLPENIFPIGVYHDDHKIWIGTKKGVVVLEENKKVQLHFPNYSISGVYKDREGNYWFSTLHQGLLFVPDINTKLLLKASSEERVSQLLLADKELWVGLSQSQFYRYSQDGFKAYQLPSQSYSSISKIRQLKDGNVWVVGKAGDSQNYGS